MIRTTESKIIEGLVSHISKGFFVDVGAAGLRGSNTAFLALERGWGGLAVERAARRVQNLRQLYYGLDVTVIGCDATSTNVNKHIKTLPDLLSIDIDGQDYWVWKAVAEMFRPAVVIIECNPRKSGRYLMPRITHYDWKTDEDRTRYGASRVSLLRLAKELGYELADCTMHNMIFKARDGMG